MTTETHGSLSYHATLSHGLEADEIKFRNKPLLAESRDERRVRLHLRA
jgi:hypothetical protein